MNGQDALFVYGTLMPGHLRWAMLALALASLRSVWASGREQFVLLFRSAASRPGKDADTMVAAGRR